MKMELRRRKTSKFMSLTVGLIVTATTTVLLNTSEAAPAAGQASLPLTCRTSLSPLSSTSNGNCPVDFYCCPAAKFCKPCSTICDPKRSQQVDLCLSEPNCDRIRSATAPRPAAAVQSPTDIVAASPKRDDVSSHKALPSTTMDSIVLQQQQHLVPIGLIVVVGVIFSLLFVIVTIIVVVVAKKKYLRSTCFRHESTGTDSGCSTPIQEDNCKTPIAEVNPNGSTNTDRLILPYS